MAITIRSVTDNIRTELNDTAGDMFGEADATALRYVIGNLRGTEQTFTFTQVATGYWTCEIGTDALFFSSATPFTDGGDTVTIDAGTDSLDPYIYRSSGSALGTSISVTATRVNYREVIADIADWRATIADQEDDSYNLDGQTRSAGTKAQRLRELAQRKRGARGV